MNDKLLRQAITDELDFEPSIDSAHIGVAADEGVITLTGFVKSYAEKVAAEEAVKRVKGVKAVAQEIEVRYPYDKKISDDEIAKRAVHILEWNVRVPHEKIQIKVHDGWVTLSGEVEWYFQRQAAEESIRRMSGVVGVTNQISMRVAAQPTDIKKRIEDALTRSAEVDANSIRVTVKDGNVTLDGCVSAWYERQLAEQAAWAAQGVTTVLDRIQVR